MTYPLGAYAAGERQGKRVVIRSVREAFEGFSDDSVTTVGEIRALLNTEERRIGRDD